MASIFLRIKARVQSLHVLGLRAYGLKLSKA